MGNELSSRAEEIAHAFFNREVSFGNGEGKANLSKIKKESGEMEKILESRQPLRKNVEKGSQGSVLSSMQSNCHQPKSNLNNSKS
mmetsp:Transcript_32223/g.31536  ORF Transcript_32223/g.31536 Transcript_32223/m.31536 type:complete len:85 (+) Transcript_32223:277-531(+)